MASRRKILVDFIKAHKAYLLFLLFLLLGSLAYWVFNHRLIEAMYEGRSLAVLNNLIQYQHKHSLEHYLALADKLFVRMLFLVFIGVSFLFIVYRLVFTSRRASLLQPVLLFLFILVTVYALNPNHRVYSYHGFYRAGIVYQILNGSVPPVDYLFAGEPLRSPWGYAFLAACVTRLLNVSPFYSFAVLNILSLLVVCLLVYRISRLLIQDRRANIFSVLISVFGTTIITPLLITASSRQISFYLEPRSAPSYQKFFNVNGVPVGLVFVFLFIYSLMRFFCHRKVGIHSVYLFIGVLGCGFFYPPLLPGILAGAAVVFFLWWRFRKRNLFPVDRKTVLLPVALLLISLALLVPYWISLSAGVKGGVALAKPGFVFRNFANFLFLSSPLLVVLYLRRNFLKAHVDRSGLLILTAILSANILSYIFLHIPDDAEYKLLLLSLTILGIFGGISFHFLTQAGYQRTSFLILLLFFLPCAEVVYTSLTRDANVSVSYREQGRYLHSADTEEDGLYEWIRHHTPTDSIFIDTEPSIPIFAQRCLFVGRDKEAWGTRGYGIAMGYLLHARHGYDFDVIEQRNRIVDTIYNLPGGSAESEVEEFFATHDKVYIVTRKDTAIHPFDRINFKEVFRSEGGIYRVYQRESGPK